MSTANNFIDLLARTVTAGYLDEDVANETLKAMIERQDEIAESAQEDWRFASDEENATSSGGPRSSATRALEAKADKETAFAEELKAALATL